MDNQENQSLQSSSLTVLDDFLRNQIPLPEVKKALHNVLFYAYDKAVRKGAEHSADDLQTVRRFYEVVEGLDNAFKDILEMENGRPKRVAGFSVLEFTRNAYYNPANNTKKAFGAAIGADDAYSSFGFYGDEVIKADGALYMYATIDDPKERGTTVGFDKRFICLPSRNKAIGAIISKKP
jgi:hypothetical protein